MTVAGRSCDLLVIGSGAGGMATAVTAAHLGLEVIVVEKHAQIGGTSAWSGGWLWIPRNPLARAAGINEQIDAPRTYLESELGDGFQPEIVDRFLEQGPQMIQFFKDRTALDFVDGNAIPDFHDTSEGAGLGGRSVCAAPFDGRYLGAHISRLRPPLAEVSPFGMGIASGADLRAFLSATVSLSSFFHVTKRLLRHGLDVLRHGRGMHLVGGNALIGRLFKSALDAGVDILTETPAQELLREDGRVVGAVVLGPKGPFEIHARRGVVLASGGFPHDVARKAGMFPHAPSGREHWSAAPDENTGDGIRLGEAAGGDFRRDLTHAGAWAPVSLVPRRDGTTGRFPHLIERGKPGLIAVRRNGQRFANEANCYHDMMNGLFTALEPGEPAEAWLIVDHAFQRRYGLGHARPRPFLLAPWLRSGYLKRGATIGDLARACGIDPAGLEATVAAFNRHAVTGADPEFHRGESAYNRIQGEADHAPNPCVAPIVQGPFYAVKVVAGSLGTFSGLRTDADARVLAADLQPVPGLYAVGNDMASMMAGRYPAGGITLGPAMTFGYVAAHHASGVSLANNRADPAL